MLTEMKTGDVVLEWNIDSGAQDGYLYTRSFPLSLGDEIEFQNIKRLRIPIILIVGSTNECIVCVSRAKYPGEINSIKQRSVNSAIFEQVSGEYPFLLKCKVIGFSELYRKNMNVIKGRPHRKMLIRKGVALRLVKTEQTRIYRLEITDKKINEWRQYAPNAPLTDYELKKDIEIEESRLITRVTRLPLDKIQQKIDYGVPQKKNVVSQEFIRNPYVVAFALKRSEGLCELCCDKAPFVKSNGDFYLEVHHLTPLSNNGRDTPSNVAALCPNCHRKLHYGKDRDTETNELIKKFSS